jgi:glycosyltransferase involved in cell wall biosynthesis
MIKISVIVPLFNKETTIERTIRSVIGQTFLDFELIIIDDGSTDKSYELVKNIIDPRIRVIKQANSGVSAARNRGIIEAKYPFIAFLDADDEWCPIFLDNIKGLIQKYPEAGIFATSYKIKSKNKIIRPKFLDIISDDWEGIMPNYFKECAYGEHPFCSSSVCIPANIFSKLGGFSVGESRGEDLEMWFRIALENPIAYSNEIGAIYHTEVRNRACDKMNLESPKILQTAQQSLMSEKISFDIMSDINEYVAKIKLMGAYNNMLCGNYHNARKILLGCDTNFYWFEKSILIIFTYFPLNSCAILKLIICIRRQLLD